MGRVTGTLDVCWVPPWWFPSRPLNLARPGVRVKGDRQRKFCNRLDVHRIATERKFVLGGTKPHHIGARRLARPKKNKGHPRQSATALAKSRTRKQVCAHVRQLFARARQPSPLPPCLPFFFGTPLLHARKIPPFHWEKLASGGTRTNMD